MTHHTTDIFCPLCEEKLSECHPVLKDAYRDIKMAFPTCHISWGYRNEADQERFFLEKKTLAHYPYSQHNITKDGKPSSRALDLFTITKGLGHAEFNVSFYMKIAEFIKDNQLPLDWSGDWIKSKEHFCETDHFQLDRDVV